MKKSILAICSIALLASCSITRPYAVTNNALLKEGRSETLMLFGAPVGGALLSSGIVLNSNFGVIEAAKEGGITKVGSVDVKVTNFLLAQKVEIIVTGE